MSVNKILNLRIQGVDIQLADSPTCQRSPLAAAALFQPRRNPRPMLILVQGFTLRATTRRQRLPRYPRLPQPLNQPRYRRRFEQTADRNLNTKARTNAADQTRRQQRMAPKRKKVVVDPNTLQPQDLGKQRAQQLLTRAARQ